MSTLEKAISIAATAHAGQVDRAGQPYILHPLRVMLRLNDPEARIVGVLHDVLEDSPVTREMLRADGFSEAVLDALDAVTRREGESYMEFVQRAALNEIGRRVKRADLLDNSDRSRISHPTEKDRARWARYQQALAMLDAIDGA